MHKERRPAWPPPPKSSRVWSRNIPTTICLICCWAASLPRWANSSAEEEVRIALAVAPSKVHPHYLLSLILFAQAEGLQKIQAKKDDVRNLLENRSRPARQCWSEPPITVSTWRWGELLAFGSKIRGPCRHA